MARQSEASSATGLMAHMLEVWLGRRQVLRGLSLAPVAEGEFVAVVGPNAAGKSTLFKALAGIVKTAGRTVLNGTELGLLPARERARRIGYLPQDSIGSAALTVFEAVLLAAKQGGAWHVDMDELTRVEQVLEDVGVDDLGLRWLGELSGGQRQLIALAQALVQEPDVLLLDEPTSALDIQHQLDLLDLVRDRCRTRGMIALAALHDLNLAARFADRLAVVAEGRIVAFDLPEIVLTPALLAQVYGIEAATSRDQMGNVIVTPLRSHRRRRDPSSQQDLSTEEYPAT